MAKLNCWEVKKCGREPGGAKVKELGICPAAVEIKLTGINDGQCGGRACWAIAGTFCEGKVQGTFANKVLNCMNCEFFRQVVTEEGKGLVKSNDIIAKLKGEEASGDKSSKEKESFQRWFLTQKDMIDLTPLKARDLIIKCFYTAQKETFFRSKQDKKLPTADKDIMTTVTGAIRAVFSSIGADYDNPAIGDLLRVVDILGANSKSWGTPHDIIEHHKKQLVTMLSRLKSKG
jgi:hypothetical protein